MDQKKTSLIIQHPITLLTLVIILLSAWVSLSPTLSTLLIFDRQALMQGEIWRIWTGHLVHFSIRHFIYDALTLGIASFLLDKSSISSIAKFYFYLAVTISVSLFILKPNMAYYGGLSGIACGALYYGALIGIKAPQPLKVISLLIIIFIPIKIMIEVYYNSSFLPYESNHTFIPMQTSHIMACIIAILFYIKVQDLGVSRHLKKD